MNSSITNAIIYTGDEVLVNKTIHISNGMITAIDSVRSENEDIIDLKGQNIAPGLIDIQINGGYSRYFSQTPDEETLNDIKKACLDFGTPYFLPTLITSPLEVVFETFDVIRQYKKEYNGLIGLHLEGPYLNPAKKGLHDNNYLKNPSDKELYQIIEKGSDVIKIMTIAPELFSDKQLNMLFNAPFIVSAGHSLMTYNESQNYFSKGFGLITHLYNAMTPLDHRECGLVGAVFDNNTVYAPIILDGAHTHYAAARIAYKIKKEKLFLVTDSSFLGKKMKKFNWERLPVELKDNYYVAPDKTLSGSAISMIEAVKNAVENLNIPIKDAVEMGTSRVSKAIKMEKDLGYIKTGYPANFLVFDDTFTNYKTLTLI